LAANSEERVSMADSRTGIGQAIPAGAARPLFGTPTLLVYVMGSHPR
jgi:hypothetical protein